MACVTSRRKRHLLGRHTLAALTFFGLAAGSGPAAAADITPITIDADKIGIVIDGEIKRGDAARFKRLVPTGKRVAVMLNSQGGILPEALEIGEFIRGRGFSTAVINGMSCNSACALIWLAGKPSGISKSAQIGFHAAYTLEEGGEARESGVANAMVGRYLTLLNLPKSAVLFATTAPPDKLNYLTAYNHEALGIDVTVLRDYDDEPKSSTQASTARADTEAWKAVGSWLVAVDHTLNDGCFMMSEFNNNTTFRIGIASRDTKSYYIVLFNPLWKSLRDGQKFKLEFKFDEKTPWDVPASTGTMRSSTMLFAKFSDTTFWEEFIQSSTLRITKNGAPVTSISLAGSAAAFNELIECDRAYASRKPRDPFAQ